MRHFFRERLLYVYKHCIEFFLPPRFMPLFWCLQHLLIILLPYHFPNSKLQSILGLLPPRCHAFRLWTVHVFYTVMCSAHIPTNELSKIPTPIPSLKRKKQRPREVDLRKVTEKSPKHLLPKNPNLLFLGSCFSTLLLFLLILPSQQVSHLSPLLQLPLPQIWLLPLC